MDFNNDKQSRLDREGHPASTYVKVDSLSIDQVKTPTYTEVEHLTWQKLIKKQSKLCPERACREFLEGLEKLELPKDQIPTLQSVSSKIKKQTGWELIRVDGLVHPKDFFELLSQKKFPSTDFIREQKDIDYTPSPDMFHDLFGHCPLLTNEEFTHFFQNFGHIGVQAYNHYPEDHPIHDSIQRLYWFSVEFGLIKRGNDIKAYGAGTISSPEEIQFALSNKCQRNPFKTEVVSQKEFDIWHLQDIVYVINSWQELENDLNSWAKKHKIIV